MAVIPVNPFMMGDATFTVEADNYEASVSSATFTPSSSVTTWKGLTPTAVFSFGANATWTLDLEFAQDWATENSLSRYLYENEGEELDVVFAPKAGGPTISATIIATPGAIGGAVDAVAASTVSLGVKGKPVLGPVTP